jgi:hypothetical protein
VFLGPAASSVHPEVEIRRVDGAELWRTHAAGTAGTAGPPGPVTSQLARGPLRPRPAAVGSIRQQQQQQQQSQLWQRVARSRAVGVGG